MGKIKNKWFRYEQVREDACGNVFCFAHAGGSAALFAKWKKIAAGTVNFYPVQYPARENRRKEAMPDGARELAEAFVRENRTLLKEKPYILFGHCFGAEICWEIIQLVKEMGEVLPVKLVVSSADSPGDDPMETVQDLTDEAITGKMCKTGYIDPMLMEDREFFDYYKQILLLDKKMMEAYDFRSQVGKKAGCPIISINGSEEEADIVANSEHWEAFADQGYEHTYLDGGHFFFTADPTQMIRFLEKQFQTEGKDGR